MTYDKEIQILIQCVISCHKTKYIWAEVIIMRSSDNQFWLTLVRKKVRL